jgi:excisionase family DNA binding protein
MTSFSLRQAAQQAGTSKSTILRAIQSGRLSATRTDDGGYSIDPAELFRVYPPKPQAVPADQCAVDGTGQNAAAFATTEITDLRIRYAQVEAAFNGLKAVLDIEKRRGEELRQERDRWATQAERLALPAPPQRRPRLLSWLKREAAWGRGFTSRAK